MNAKVLFFNTIIQDGVYIELKRHPLDKMRKRVNDITKKAITDDKERKQLKVVVPILTE